MPKKYPPGYIKDPRKVAAGKARAASGIKDNAGKYVSKIFQNEISRTYLAIVEKQDVTKVNVDQSKEIAKLLHESKVTPKQLKEFYEKSPLVFADLIEHGTLTGTNRNSNQIERDINDYKGQILIDTGSGHLPVTKAQAKYELMQFKQYLFQYANVVDFKIKPTYNIDGKQVLQIPDKKEFLQRLKDELEITSYKDLADIETTEVNEAIERVLNNMFGKDQKITIYSSPAGKAKAKAKNSSYSHKR